MPAPKDAVMTAQEVYDQAIKPLPAADRLRLAALILNDFPPQAVVDYSEEWTDEDLRDFTLHGLRHIDDSLRGEEVDASAER